MHLSIISLNKLFWLISCNVVAGSLYGDAQVDSGKSSTALPRAWASEAFHATHSVQSYVSVRSWNASLHGGG